MGPPREAAPDGPDGDLELARAIARGDAPAVREALDAFLPRVYAVAHRLLGDPGEAEEVAQETFLRVWRHAGRWQPRGARLSTWVTRIAVNLCYDRLRRDQRRRTASLDAAPDVADESPGAGARLAERERKAAVDAALAELPPRQRLAIQLVHIEEMTNIEAAAVMDVSVEAVESLLARGRRGLHARLIAQREDLLGEA